MTTEPRFHEHSRRPFQAPESSATSGISIETTTARLTDSSSNDALSQQTYQQFRELGIHPRATCPDSL